MSHPKVTIEPIGSNNSDPCSCCGGKTRTVWGSASMEGDAVAVYYVRWTIGREDHAANFDLIVGKWGEGTSPKDRIMVATLFRMSPEGPQFMVTDATEHPMAVAKELATTAMRREQVIGTPLAATCFAIIDAIWLHDERIVELTRSRG